MRAARSSDAKVSGHGGPNSVHSTDNGCYCLLLATSRQCVAGGRHGSLVHHCCGPRGSEAATRHVGTSHSGVGACAALGLSLRPQLPRGFVGRERLAHFETSLFECNQLQHSRGSTRRTGCRLGTVVEHGMRPFALNESLAVSPPRRRAWMRSICPSDTFLWLGLKRLMSNVFNTATAFYMLGACLFSARTWVQYTARWAIVLVLTPRSTTYDLSKRG
jgi:hypothetical protein